MPGCRPAGHAAGLSQQEGVRVHDSTAHRVAKHGAGDRYVGRAIALLQLAEHLNHRTYNWHQVA